MDKLLLDAALFQAQDRVAREGGELLIVDMGHGIAVRNVREHNELKAPGERIHAHVTATDLTCGTCCRELEDLKCENKFCPASDRFVGDQEG